MNVLTDKYLRTCGKRITARDMSKFFASMGVKVSQSECTEYLETSPWVFPLEDGTFVTRAAVFTGEVFSIKPTSAEIDQKMFVPGTRCAPFVDPEMLSSSLTFVFEKTGQKLPKKVGTFDSDLAIDMFILCGEEYAPQYIASDPANVDEDFAFRDYELSNNVNLTGVDISDLIDSFGFKKGDRLLCVVEDWDLGIIRLDVVLDGHNTFNVGKNGSLRIDWYKKLEDSLLSSFKRLGPCSSMEEQMANVFFENLQALSIPQCGSIEEYINMYAKKVAICSFGVETRLWFKDQTVPAIGEWNGKDIEDMGFQFRRRKNQTFILSFPLEVLDQYIIDSYYRREKDFEALLQRMYPTDYAFHKDEKALMQMTVKQRNVILSKRYNWFRDQENGFIRGEALRLFTVVNGLLYKVDNSAYNLKDLPQNELVILTQLYGHLLNILQSINERGVGDDERVALLSSIDGMRWNLEDIQDIIEYAVRSQRPKGFSIVKE